MAFGILFAGSRSAPVARETSLIDYRLNSTEAGRYPGGIFRCARRDRVGSLSDIGLNLVQVHSFRKLRSRALGKGPYAGFFRSSAKCRPPSGHAVHGANMVKEFRR